MGGTGEIESIGYMGSEGTNDLTKEDSGNLPYALIVDGGGWEGVHCEGSITRTLFSLLFWESVLFADKADVFVTPYQVCSVLLLHTIHTICTIYPIHPIHPVHPIHPIHTIHTIHTIHNIHPIHFVLCITVL